MRVSSHSGRVGKNGVFKVNHNDRKFDISKATHIDVSKIKDNIEYRNIQTQKEFKDLESYEKHVYNITFSKGQDAKNNRYIKQRHPERCRNTDYLYSYKRTCPEETIKQVGQMNETISPEAFSEIMQDYTKRFNTMFKDNVMILDYEIHLDESTPHAHLRRTFVAHDDEGNKIPNESKALKELGILPPSPDEVIGRYNNAKITFTELDRKLFIEVVQDHGFNIETEPIHGRKAKTLAEYKLEKINEEIALNKEVIDSQKTFLSSLKEQIKVLMDKVNILKVAQFIFKHDKELYDAIEEHIQNNERNINYGNDNIIPDEQGKRTLDVYQEIER